MPVKNPCSRSNQQIVTANLFFQKDLIKGQQKVHNPQSPWPYLCHLTVDSEGHATLCRRETTSRFQSATLIAKNTHIKHIWLAVNTGYPTVSVTSLIAYILGIC